MNYINWGIIATGALTIILVALQDRSSGAGGVFGSGDAGGFYQTRRGVEKVLFILTVSLIAIFVGLSILNLTRFGAPTPATPKIGDIKVEAESGSLVEVGSVTTKPADNPASSTAK